MEPPSSSEVAGEWSLDERALVDWGEAIGRAAVPPLVLALAGDLGTGKTTLARAIARGAGVRGPVPSPTYNLLFRYPATGGTELVHLDLYRLERPEDVWALGWGELPDEREVVIIEWPERAGPYLPATRWDVTLAVAEDEDHRLAKLTPVGGPSTIPLPAIRTALAEDVLPGQLRAGEERE